ncbi:Helix-turn-helix domain-containing protein [Lentzea fradiae]|uniref:Helix-turn-helix domain-containing protein n=1 Tax=Lentzea fradiae TaxID=200378 RepID=A0A1G7S718_9PSEU|nr:helix-turn-helix transcriptional regulator [Lentzea fradiae]SDG18788.1 Helix-turn-helix domain-containing protein [Lentzea fradiae]
MAADGSVRRCACGTRLARDNRGRQCNACKKKARDLVVSPPVVPPEFWRTAEMCEAFDTCDMGAVIRAYRTHGHHGRTISQEVAARWLGISQTRLSRIEGGEGVSDLPRLMRWAHVLGMPRDLLWFRMPGRPQTAAEDRQARTPEGVDTPDLGNPGGISGGAVKGERPSGALTAAEQDTMPLSRRSLLFQGVAAATLPGVNADEADHIGKALENARRYSDAEIVASFTRQLDNCKADDGMLGSDRTLPTLLGMLGAIKVCAQDAKPDIRRALFAVGARGAEFAGWLCRDLHDQARATFWHDRATEWAQLSGDLPMQGYVLLKKAQTAYDDRDAVNVLGFAEAAQSGPWNLPPKVRAEVAQQEARGLAMLGLPMLDVERKLERSREYLSSAGDSADNSGLATHYSISSLTLQTASCYIEAGKPLRAAMLYSEVLNTGVLSTRDQGYFLARRASALALSGEPDDAATVGLQAAELAAATSSARTRRELGRTVATLQPWASRPAPRALREVLTG